MIRDPLEITDYFHQHGNLFSIFAADLLRAQFDKIRAQNIFIMIGKVFLVPDAFLQLRCVMFKAL